MRAARCTHRDCSRVKLPKLEGRLPLSWLELMKLRARLGHLSAARIRRVRRVRSRTHRDSNAVMLPRLEGRLPLSRLSSSQLRV
jgi:hypothetical protein